MNKMILFMCVFMVLGSCTISDDIADNTQESFLTFVEKYKVCLFVENPGVPDKEKTSVLGLIKDNDDEKLLKYVVEHIHEVILANELLDINQKCICYVYVLQAQGYSDKAIIKKVEEFEIMNKLNQEVK